MDRHDRTVFLYTGRTLVVDSVVFLISGQKLSLKVTTETRVQPSVIDFFSFQFIFYSLKFRIILIDSFIRDELMLVLRLNF